MIAIGIIIICIITFFFEDPWMLQNFALVPGLVWSEPWRLITSMFLHADVMHLLFNMLALFMFGTYLEKKVGGLRFLAIYIVSGIIGGLGFCFFSGSADMAIGASGAIFGIIGALVVLEPKMKVYVYFVPMPILAAGVLYAVIELIGMGGVDNIAHSAHLLGLLGGVALAFIYKSMDGAERWS